MRLTRTNNVKRERGRLQFLVALQIALVAVPSPPSVVAGDQHVSHRPVELPRLFLLNAHFLIAVREEVREHDPALDPAMRRLLADADGALNAGPFSVMQKQTTPPSGDKHDYMSQAPYWWPNPVIPGGRPYVLRDGRTNPEIHKLDRQPLESMCLAVNTLALAYYLTNHERYADHAARLLRTWFLDETSRMNPHLKYAQAIPGWCQGRGIGIIDTESFPQLLDSVGLLAGSAAWTRTDQAGLRAWFRTYLTWLLQSCHGREESRQANNHGTYYDRLVASVAMFVEDAATARSVLDRVADKRIARQIEPDGRQPQELRRARSLDYSAKNLTGLLDLASLAEHVGVDLWTFQTADGRSIRRALDRMIDYVETGNWKHRQITPFHDRRLLPILRRAAIHYRDRTYEDLVPKLGGIDPASDRINLLYPRPSL